MKNKYFGIILMIVCTFFTSAGQFLLKKGLNTFDMSSLINFNLIFGLIFYGLGAILLIISLKFGNLNALYPIISLTYIWVAVISYVFLKETIDTRQISGIFVILGGVYLITREEGR